MLKGLRLRLTGVYLVAGLALVLGVGAIAYGLLEFYFRAETDRALEERLQRELVVSNLDRSPSSGDERSRLPNLTRSPRSDDHDDHESFDSALAAISVVAIGPAGSAALPGGARPPATSPVRTGIDVAASGGRDLRSITIDGTSYRVLTVRVDGSKRITFLQLARSLDDQQRILSQLLLGLLVAGAGGIAVLGGVSWWLSGRTIRPAEQAWERQQSFVANASHELRTPLTLLRASADVALREASKESADLRELLKDVLDETDYTSRLVDDLLLLSRLDSGKLPLTPEQIDALSLLEDIRRQVGRIADDRGIELAIDAAPARLRADPARLRQVLLILLDNALRYTPSGGTVTLGARPDGHRIRLWVSDTGPGIPAEHVPRLFERFYRADSSHARETGGSGLGLAIAHSLVVAQGGEIGIRSVPGQGTTVDIRLPAVGR